MICPMARTRYVTEPGADFGLPPTTTTHGFGGLVSSNPQAGRQDRDLQRFHGKKGPRGTQERLGKGHGLTRTMRVGKFASSV